MVITVDCPSCATSFPVDTNKVPEGGVNARCSECGAIFRVERPAESVIEPTEPTVASAVADAVVESEVAEPEAAAVQEAAESVAESVAESFEEIFPEVTFEEAGPETPEEPAAEESFAYGEEEADVAPGGVELAGAEAIEEHVIEEVLEEDAEAPAAEGATSEADGSDWGALRELLEDVGAGDAGQATVEDEAIAEAEFATDERDLGDVDVGEEAVAEAVADEFPPTLPEALRDAPGASPPAVAAVDAPAAGSDIVWDVDRDVERPTEQAPSDSSPGWFTFARQDPQDKARRLARVLVSDMVMYNPERHDRALNNGTLKEDFEEEIRKSWREYVEQVGEDMATSTTYWSDALNELLAKGQQIF